MPGSRRPPDAAIALMVLLCAIWGAQQVAIKLAAADVVPIMEVALRSGISASLVALFSRWRGEQLSFRDRTWRPGLLVFVGAPRGLERIEPRRVVHAEAESTQPDPPRGATP